MSHLLHIDSSIRSIGESRSRKLSARYRDAWRSANPDGTVTYRDLAANPAPHINADSAAALMLPADQQTPSQKAERAISDELAAEVVAADTIVVAMGLYNFGVPSTVKAWFDRIVVPGLTVGESGGLLGDKELVLVLAAGGGYSEGTPRHGWDHRDPWLRHAFEFLGLTNVTTVVTELTLARESPMMIPLDLGDAEDQSYAAAEALIDAQFAAVA